MTVHGLLLSVISTPGAVMFIAACLNNCLMFIALRDSEEHHNDNMML